VGLHISKMRREVRDQIKIGPPYAAGIQGISSIRLAPR
jgi:hypothetical protein